MELLFNGDRVSVMQDEKVLQICCTTVNSTVLYTYKLVKRVDLMCFLPNTKIKNKNNHNKIAMDLGSLPTARLCCFL